MAEAGDKDGDGVITFNDFVHVIQTKSQVRAACCTIQFQPA
jgi:Ca2+-binding EF-hand superfamily protein